MKKLITVALATLFVGSLFAQGYADGTFVEGNTGTTSATAIIESGSGFAHVTDLVWDVDSGNTSATVDIRPAKTKYTVTSATSASGTTLWFTNTGGSVTNQSYVIYHDVSAGNYYLYKATGSASTTSITVQDTITPATAVGDYVYSVAGTYRRNAQDITSSSTIPVANIWLPADYPSAFTIDGNTTACKITVSGVRSRYVH